MISGLQMYNPSSSSINAAVAKAFLAALVELNKIQTPKETQYGDDSDESNAMANQPDDEMVRSKLHEAKVYENTSLYDVLFGYVVLPSTSKKKKKKDSMSMTKGRRKRKPQPYLLQQSQLYHQQQQPEEQQQYGQEEAEPLPQQEEDMLGNQRYAHAERILHRDRRHKSLQQMPGEVNRARQEYMNTHTPLENGFTAEDQEQALAGLRHLGSSENRRYNDQSLRQNSGTRSRQLHHPPEQAAGTHDREQASKDSDVHLTEWRKLKEQKRHAEQTLNEVIGNYQQKRDELRKDLETVRQKRLALERQLEEQRKIEEELVGIDTELSS